MTSVRHDVDDRPASPLTRAYVVLMRLARDKQAFEGAQRTLATALRRQREGDRAPTPWTRLTCRVTSRRLHTMGVWTVRPRRRRPAVRVVYLHGGGYVHPLTPDYWRLVRALVASPAEVVVPTYPLAPDATVDDVLPRLLDLVLQPSALPTVLMGDSAGGALAIVLAQQLRDQGCPQPSAVVALCPWLDATLDEHQVAALEATDPMLAESGLRAAGHWWSGPHSPEDPLVSPVNGNLADLAPLDVYVGDHDILRPAVDDLESRGAAAGLRLTVHEVSAMFHVWMTRAIPEGRRTRRDLARLVVTRAQQ